MFIVFPHPSSLCRWVWCTLPTPHAHWFVDFLPSLYSTPPFITGMDAHCHVCPHPAPPSWLCPGSRCTFIQADGSCCGGSLPVARRLQPHTPRPQRHHTRARPTHTPAATHRLQPRAVTTYHTHTIWFGCRFYPTGILGLCGLPSIPPSPPCLGWFPPHPTPLFSCTSFKHGV